MTKKHKEHHFVVVSDDVLVADLSLSKTAGVVRLKLADLTFAHFHVRSDGDGAKLGFTTGREDFVVLGNFANKADADHLLKEIRHEMLKIELLHRIFSMRTFLITMSVIITLVFLMWFYGKATQQNLPELNEPLALEDMHDPLPTRMEPGRPIDADNKLNPPD